MQNYGIDIWSDDNFLIDKGLIRIKHKSKPSLLEITHKIRAKGIRGPLLLRFPHLVSKQIKAIYEHFERAIMENAYEGSFHAVFPLKVNQYPNFVKHIIDKKLPYPYGLEAGSKAELLLAMALNKQHAPLTVNGFKDQNMIELGFLAANMGEDITITIEGLSELELIIQEAKTHPQKNLPKIGIRMRLHSSGSGIWAKSGGIASKFGLTSTELIEAIELLKEAELLEQFTMIHFHIGSQIENINPLKKALREVGNLYAELIKMGAHKLKNINIGGGLAVEYSQHSHKLDKNYSLEEFSNDVIFLLKSIANDKQVPQPNIFTESGRFIAAHHAVLVAPVLELFSHDYQEKSLRLKESNPPLVTELNELFETINRENAKEFLHDALDHLESLLTLFDLGYIDLIDRSNAEVITHLIIKKALYLLSDHATPELKKLQGRLQERYLINASFFQSIPDFWGLNQHFPIMPIHKLDQKAVRAATLWDISCDSDGEIPYSDSTPLLLHDVNLDEEEYFIAFFLLGAYQEVLGMKHNLFSRPTEVTVTITTEGFELQDLLTSESIESVIQELGYESHELLSSLKNKINSSNLLSKQEKDAMITNLMGHLHENGYLQTIQ